MATKLKDLTVRMVALVDKGANQDAHITLVKRDHSATKESKMTDAEKAALETQIADSAAKLKAAQDELASLKGSNGLTGDVEDLRREHAKSQGELTRQREELHKQLAASRAEAEATKAEVEKLHKARRREEFVKLCAQLEHLPGAAADDMAEILDETERAIGRQKFDKLAARLRGWNTQAAKSKVFEEFGRNDNAGSYGSAEGALTAMAREYAAANKVTFEKAYAHVMREHPNLYKQYLAERGDR